MTGYKLTSKNRGRGEITHFIFSVAGLKYTDERFKWEDDSFKAGIFIVNVYYDLMEKDK